SSSTPAQVIREQISAHGYLKEGGREEITNDSMRLIEELPERLGATLEIGFGYGLTARRVAARATRYVGIDLQVEQCQTLRELGGEGAVADLHRLPFKDGSFDTVIADNVLEHAYDPLAALTEIRRALRRGGRVYSLLPLDGRTSLHQIRSHLWKADEEGIDEAVRRAGLRMLRKQILEYGKLGVYGCFPASEGKTCLMVLEREASIESMPPPPKGAP
ncbi:MAG: methyltransferase domain-containing protein, partial [Planctomycetota bacterium]